MSDDDTTDEDGEHFGLVMPFICTESHGGTYDDLAFAAGMSIGMLWRDFFAAVTVNAERWASGAAIRSDLREQVDLIAMENGYTMTVDSDDGEWMQVTFTRSAGAPDEDAQ